MRVLLSIFTVIAIISLAANVKGSSDCSACYYSYLAINNLKAIIMTDKEIFKDIAGFEGLYQVSNFGNVKSLRRTSKGKNNSCRTLKERILKPKMSVNGYFMVSLFKGKEYGYTIHQLVAMTFMNHVPCGYKIVVDHEDFNKTNNKLSNLKLISNRDNTNQKHLKSSSKYVGVSWDKKDQKWRASIRINGKSKNLGNFTNELKASEMYQLALKNII